MQYILEKCGREKLNEVIRAAFDNRKNNPICVVYHAPAEEKSMELYKNKAGMIFEGCSIDSWSSGQSRFENAKVGFTMNGRCFSLPIHEIVEFSYYS